MAEDKYLSIITNFGCHYNCPYCIVKNNNIDVPKTTVKGLAHLKDAVDFEFANIISVSGGGDPLYEYEKHKKYYKRLFKICKDIVVCGQKGIRLEMHTSYIGGVDFPFEKCHRVVYHCNAFEQLRYLKRHCNEIVRAVFVVTKDFTPEKIDAIAEFVENSDIIDELSFRQMVDKDYRVTDYCQEYLRAGHKKKWWYIEQCDYNSYYVNGTIYYRFSDIGR